MGVHFFRAALITGTVMTGLGALAPLLPQTDMANHFRPYTLAGAGVILVLALALRPPTAVRWSVVLVALNAALLLLPLLWSADAADRQAFGQAQASTGQRDIKVVTFNLYTRNHETESIAQFLLQEDADIVLLQEVTEQHFTVLSATLSARYPFWELCLVQGACRQAIFAKRPWVSVEHLRRDDQTPEMISVLFDDGERGALRVHGVHLATPYRPRQARQTDHLIAKANAAQGPVLLAGDLNMTPWSYGLQRLLASTGLRRHATFLRSWPMLGNYRLPVPAFLIDHVLTTPDIKAVSIRTGPYLGSDHLPIIAVLRLPR
jgi:endonuclease/exonuclease/phosphatase (EEP) superfamily protein YafD